MQQSANVNELKQITKCRSTILLKYFETNRKGEVFKTCNSCRSKNVANKELHKEATKEYNHQYRIDNIDKIKEHHEQNIDAINEYNKQYRIDHKEQINEHNRQKWLCPICNKSVNVNAKSQHEKSQLHIDFKNPIPGKEIIFRDGARGYQAHIKLSDEQILELLRSGYTRVVWK